MIHVNLQWMAVLLLLRGAFYKCHLHPDEWWYFAGHLYPYSLLLAVSVMERNVEVCHSERKMVYFSFDSMTTAWYCETVLAGTPTLGLIMFAGWTHPVVLCNGPMTSTTVLVGSVLCLKLIGIFLLSFI